MAKSCCAKCGHTKFEAQPVEPANYDFKVIALQCSHCGGVVTFVDWYNIGGLIHLLAKELGKKLP